MKYATQRLAEAISELPERLKLYAAGHHYEQIPDANLAAELGLTPDQLGSLAAETAAALSRFLVCTAEEASRAEDAAVAALRSRLEQTTGKRLDRDGRLTDRADATVGTIPADALRLAFEDVAAGDGNELRPTIRAGQQPRFCSARSSCALVVNAFGPWRAKADRLQLLNRRGFSELRFEGKCPIRGVSGHKPPNLDMVVTSGATSASPPSVIAVEAKMIEYLRPAAPAVISSDYDDAIEKLAHPSWRVQVERLKRSPREFGYFGAAQLIKHYLGLKSCFPQAGVDLIYLYWEPLDRARHPLFEQHRAKIASFGSCLNDPELRFQALSYADLFRDWATSTDAKTTAHVEQLRQRYELTIFS